MLQYDENIKIWSYSMSVYYVFQGETYVEERNGGFVWSPKLNQKGIKTKGFSTMTKIKRGDFIIHHCNGEIKAISITKNDCYESIKPYKIGKGNNWSNEGYRVDTNYTEFDKSVKLADHKDWLMKHYSEDSAFTKNGTGKQQYMCTIVENHALYLLEQAMKLQSNEATIKVINDALADIREDESGEYYQAEKDEIDSLIESTGVTSIKPTWSGIKQGQKLTMSASANKLRPRRDPKVAANALARADYKCEFNVNDRIFLRKSGKGYTEPHHLIPISKFRDFDYKNCSLDTMENIVSLCSHCHNLLHYGREVDKTPVLNKLYKDRKDALAKVGLDITFDELKEYYK